MQLLAAGYNVVPTDADKLSILYLRCHHNPRPCQRGGVRDPFNSLFEMRLETPCALS